ncbi:DUF6056 family protein [Hymenobacter terricola]|uniref:DUF6056 family protein n=1 Tax=Hymenobacter terricola TaxID=2819236 RepID=UPI001B30A587|nr:DUF6056 family protein [Hymenobacter terricola]
MSSSTSRIVCLFQRHQNLLITISLVLVALPFVGLSFYNHPSLDDILDAVKVKEVGFWQAQKYFYNAHTGRYTTTVLLASINPLLYSRLEARWWWVALVFITGTLLVLRLCATRVPGISAGGVWRLAGVVLGLWLAYAPGQAEGLYWFTGAYTYVMTAWLLLLWMVALSRYAAARPGSTSRRSWLVGLAGLTLAVAGTTEPVALPFLLALLVGAGLSLWYRQGRVLVLLAVLAAVGSAVSFTAPGNFVRMTDMGNSFGIVKTLVYSVATTGYLLLTWASNPVLLVVSALLLPAMNRIARQRGQLLVVTLARVPAGVLAASLAVLMAAASSPAFYASGTGLPLRARTTLYLLFLVGWFGVLLTWCCRQVDLGQPSAVLRGLITSRMTPLWVGLLVIFFVADYNVQTRATMLGQGSNNVVRAYRQWLGGEAARYDAELRARYQRIHAGGPVVEIRPLLNRPDLLYNSDFTNATSPGTLQNYARYFGAKQIIDAPTTKAGAKN